MLSVKYLDEVHPLIFPYQKIALYGITCYTIDTNNTADYTYKYQQIMLIINK